MRVLTLPTHRPMPVTVDHCPDCRLVWFDELESVQLDGLGWVRLLREMEHGARHPLADAQVTRPGCPVCAAPLQQVQNRSRFGLFSALECPRRHGHLHSHSGVLAERGLVRPLGVAERKALQREEQSLHCLNCGGAAAASDDACSWCGTALVVLDVPRLAHSLRLRLDGMGPSPQAVGQHTAWACRGCGAALDPGRDTHCAQCGHLVVAYALPAIGPLLDAAEAELTAAAAADARRHARLASSRQERGASAPAGPGTRSRAWPSAVQALLLRGWAPLLALLLASLALLLGLVAELPWSRRTPVQVLLAQPVGANPGAAWGWVAAHRALAPGDEAGARKLRRGVFDLVTRQLAGARWPAEATVGSLLSGPDAAGRGAEDRWTDGLGRHLQAQLAPPDLALPADATAGAARNARFDQVAPGLWLNTTTRNEAVWLVSVKNTGPATVYVGTMGVTMMTAPPDGVPWKCQPADRAGTLLHPGEALAILCHNTVLVSLQEELWAGAVLRLRDATPVKLFWHDNGLSHAGGVDRLSDRLADDAVARSAPLDAYLRAHNGLRRDNPALLAAAFTPMPQGSVRARVQARWAELSGRERASAALAALLVAWVGYCALARGFGERRALVGMAVLFVPVCVGVGRGEGAASVLIVGMYLAFATGVVFAFSFAYRVYRAAVFRRMD